MSKTKIKSAYDPDELVSVRLFKDNEHYKDDVFVAVNGESILIKRGETVSIKRKFADVLEQSMAQDAASADLMDRQAAQFAADTAAAGL